MKVPVSFQRVFALMIVFVLLAAPGSSAWMAQSEPGLPGAPQPAPLGSTLLQEQQVSATLTPTDPKRYLPQSAFDSQNGRYLVVWHQVYDSGHDREVYGQLVTADGKRYGPQKVISSGPHDRVQPSVAYNSYEHEFLVLYMYDVNGDEHKYDIYGQRVNTNGDRIGSEFIVQTFDNGTHWSPELAYSPFYNIYMAVWTAANTTTQLSTGIGMKMLNNIGTPYYGTVLTSDGFPSDPDITYDPVHHNFMVVWNFVNTSGKNAIMADLRDPIGNRIKLVPVYGSETTNAFTPRVTSTWGFGAGWFFVTFEVENVVNDHDIYIGMTNDTGSIDPMITSNIVSGSTHDTHPDIAGDPDRSQYVVTFQRADAQGAKVMMAPYGTTWPANVIPVCEYFGSDCLTPSITFGGGSYLITYAEEYISLAPDLDSPTTPPTVRHIFDRIFNQLSIFVPIVRKN